MAANRSALLALAVLCASAAAIALAQSKAHALGSAAFAWDKIAERTTPTGSARKFFQAPTALLGELECHVTTLNPGQDPHPPHQHPEEELYIIKEGTVEVLINGERTQVGAGSVVFAAANQPHGIRNAGATQATYHVIKWKAPAAANAQTL
jgi:quercetin dioxygenase-like cupin family protein